MAGGFRMKLNENGLTLKQQAFVDEYLIDLSTRHAAIRAGYSPKSADAIGSETLGRPKVKEAIRKRMEEKQNKRIASQDEVLELLTQAARGEMIEECVVVEGQGEGISEARKIDKKIVPNDRLKALGLLAKRYGLDKVVVDVNASNVVRIVDDLSD